MKSLVILSVKNVQKIKDCIKLEKELNKLKSVRSRVNIASHLARVKYNQKHTHLEKILDVIIDCGFFAVVSEK